MLPNYTNGPLLPRQDSNLNTRNQNPVGYRITLRGIVFALPRQDLNLDRLIQNQLCCRITPRGKKRWSARRDLNPLSRKATDLQSVVTRRRHRAQLGSPTWTRTRNERCSAA